MKQSSELELRVSSFRAGGHMFLISSGLVRSVWGADKAAWCVLGSWCAGVGMCSLTLVGQEKNTRLTFWGETCELWVAKEGETCTKMPLCPPPLTCFSWPAASWSQGGGQFLWDLRVSSLEQGYFALGSTLHLYLTKNFCFYWLKTLRQTKFLT